MFWDLFTFYLAWFAMLVYGRSLLQATFKVRGVGPRLARESATHLTLMVMAILYLCGLLTP